MALRARRLVLAVLVATAALLLLALPAFAATTIEARFAEPSWSRVSVSVAYSCELGSPATEVAVDVVDLNAVGAGSTSSAPSCDGLEHTMDVAVPMRFLVPLLVSSAHPGDNVMVSLALVDSHAQVDTGATDSRMLTLR